MGELLEPGREATVSQGHVTELQLGDSIKKKKSAYLCSSKDVDEDVHDRVLHYSPKLKTAQIFTNKLYLTIMEHCIVNEWKNCAA